MANHGDNVNPHRSTRGAVRAWCWSDPMSALSVGSKRRVEFATDFSGEPGRNRTFNQQIKSHSPAPLLALQAQGMWWAQRRAVLSPKGPNNQALIGRMPERQGPQDEARESGRKSHQPRLGFSGRLLPRQRAPPLLPWSVRRPTASRPTHRQPLDASQFGRAAAT